MKKKKTNESQVEIVSGRRREILRTARRNSLNGAENGSRARKRGGVGAYEYVVNQYGLTVKRCCASCAHKVATDNLHHRKCTRKKKKVRPTDCCRQWKLKVGGWVQVSLEFSVNDRKTQDGREFKAQRVRIINISPLWGHEEPADKAF